ncbi:MAG TPA: DUF1501 domain-containing protein [Polyangiaceae bacterium]|nr:DUF1501 domain-containing protein [Polyangiaceae bacterium]
MPTRREILLGSMFGTLATGLPAWFLMDPRRASAQNLACAIDAKENLQFLICCVNSNGDPISNNCPGTYDDVAEGGDAIHPEDTTMEETSLTWGDKTYKAAAPWGTLTDATRARTAFIHHVTLGNNHGDQPKVMRLMGATKNSEMLLSAYAKELAPCFGTVQNEPIALGAGGNASELLSYQGRTLPAVSPTQLRQLLTGSTGAPMFGGGGGGGARPGGTRVSLVNLRSIRDKYLDQLHTLAKQDSTGVQMQFLDALAQSRAQTRQLAEQLAETLSAIDDDGVASQGKAAAALIQANVSPVLTVRISFGGDNHSDNSLANEVSQHTATDNGCAGIQAIMDELTSASLQDKVTFMTFNVFGRNLNDSKASARSGRDHYGNHSVAVVIGKNVNPGVYGGVRAVNGGQLGASGIDSATGDSVASDSDADIPRLQTHVAMARTVGAALGLTPEIVDNMFNTDAGGKLITAAIVGA